MKIAVISANLNSYDEPHKYVEQELQGDCTVDYYRLTDQTFPPRPLAMTARLRCAIPKMFGWQLFPGYDVYIWVDASCALLHPYSVMWFLRQLDTASIVLFKHPDRNSVREEYEFLKQKLLEGNRYLKSRYEAEWLDEQMNFIQSTAMPDNNLYASTSFAYTPTRAIKGMMKEWFHHKCRYLLHDQLALPYAIWDACIARVNVINEDYRKCDYITYVRNLKQVAKVSSEVTSR